MSTYAKTRYEQDEEYENCVIMDLAKQYEREAARIEEEEMLRANRMIEEEMLKAELLRQHSLRLLAAHIPAEPPAGAADLITVVFRLRALSGKLHKVSRRFRRTETVQQVLDFAACLDMCGPRGANTYTSFPVTQVLPSNTPLQEYFEGQTTVSLMVESADI